MYTPKSGPGDHVDATTSPKVPPANEPRPDGRLDSYDLVKGFLVEVMILHHSLGYFGDTLNFLRYIDFVTGAFVFLSGSAVTHYYLKAYRQQMGLIVRRLLTRSVKLIVLFTLLNTGIHLIVKKNYNGVDLGLEYFYGNLYQVFILGSKRIAAFEILLPIAYTLALGGILVLLLRSKLLLGVLVSAAFAVCFYFDVYAQDLPFNVKFLLLGLVGVVYGCVRQEDFAENTKRSLAWITGVTVAAYLTTVTLIERDNLAIYLVGVVGVVQCVTMAAEKAIPRTSLLAMLKLFGRYSLLSYLLQILFLQCLVRLAGKEASGLVSVTVAILITNLFLNFLLLGFSFLRARYQFVRVAYQTAFA